MDAETAIRKLKIKIQEIEQFSNKERLCPEFKKWYRETWVLLKRIFGDGAYQVEDFTQIQFVYSGMHMVGDAAPFERRYRSALKDAQSILTSIFQEIEEFGLDTPGAVGANPISSLELILSRFHSVARQLRRRHGNRPTLDVTDEYDVQDLLHGLLRIYFKDIRPEEWTPSYAGNASRMDFLLHPEEIVIETKMTRRGLSERDLVDELIVDSARYKEHPRCKLLVCFVYDPDGYIGNGATIVSDLEKSCSGIDIRVFVYPQNH